MENTLGIRYTTKNGSVEQKINETLPNMVALAEHEFEAGLAESVCVYDMSGKAKFYLKRTPNGVIRETF